MGVEQQIKRASDAATREMNRVMGADKDGTEIHHHLAIVTFVHPDGDCSKAGEYKLRKVIYADGPKNDPREGERRLRIDEDAGPVCVEEGCGETYEYVETTHCGTWNGSRFELP